MASECWQLDWSAEAEFQNGEWSVSGSGTETGNAGETYGFAASGSVSQGALTGQYSEQGQSHAAADWQVDHVLAPEGWTRSGSGSGSGTGQVSVNYDLTETWTRPTQGGSMSGETNWAGSSQYAYDFTNEWTLGETDEAWVLSAGGGSRTSSGSGTYSYEFDDGAGLVEGTVETSSLDSLNYTFEHVFTVVDGAWHVDESGEGTYHGFAGTAYAGSGSYSQSSSSPNGSSSLRAEIQESGGRTASTTASSPG